MIRTFFEATGLAVGLGVITGAGLETTVDGLTVVGFSGTLTFLAAKKGQISKYYG